MLAINHTIELQVYIVHLVLGLSGINDRVANREQDAELSAGLGFDLGRDGPRVLVFSNDGVGVLAIGPFDVLVLREWLAV